MLDCIQFFVCLFVFVGLGFELRAPHLQNRLFMAGVTTLVHFALVILEMGSHELFSQAGFKPRSFHSQPPTQLGLQV
jgi:hypothetical protein